MGTRWAYYRHPQYLWTHTLRRMLKDTLPSSDGTVIDAPCGDGIITYWLGRSFPSLSFELYDRSAASVARVTQLQPWLPRVEVGDIRDVSATAGDSIWLLINSLYLLPDIDSLVDRLHPRMKHVLAVFPYTDHANYHAYFKRHPTEQNVNAMTHAQTLSFMADHDYDLVEVSDATYVPFHRLAMGPIHVVTARLFNIVDTCLSRHLPPCYWIARFIRR